MLETKICGVSLSSPLILGSGTLGEKKENLIKALEAGAGGVVTRTLRLAGQKRKVFSPAYFISENYMLNADNQNITPWDYWLDKVQEIEKLGRLIISLSARQPDDCREIIRSFENKQAPSFYEINFSCPHSAKIYGEISYGSARKALEGSRKVTDRPLFLKLSINNLDLKELQIFEKECLMDALVLSNSIGPGMEIDLKNRKPVLESVVGGMSGKAIKPLVLAAIYELKKNLKTPVIGVGGIEKAEDVLEYLMLGCEAVQIYTKAHTDGVGIFGKIKEDLEKFFDGKKIEDFKGGLKLTF
jgi:dihydroorotate dehydrogenase (NAD+) catalytic subunit